MLPLDFAGKYLKDYRVKGSEIVPKYCPFCQGGKNKDKFSFALNMDKQTYNCKRGSCNKQGTFYQLCREFGETADTGYEFKQPRKVYKKPDTETKALTKKAIDYIKLRGISQESIDKRQVAADEKGNIVFPYYENGEVVMMKFRRPGKYRGKGMKAWRSEGGKPVLWGIDLCDISKPLIITEGEYDTMVLDTVGIENAVSVPSGAEDLTWIEICWDWLQNFNKIILFGDNDEAGQKMIKNVIVRLGEDRCYIVDYEGKDANELLYRQGADAVREAVENAKLPRVEGLLNLADVVPYDVSKVDRVRSNIRWLDGAIGGFVMGELSVWTGKRGEGKSTFLGQTMIEAIDQDVNVCVYSGELRADRFQYWIHLQMAGKDNIKQYVDDVRERNVAYVDKETAKKIKAWYDGKFWLYDNSYAAQNAEAKGILKIFEYAVKRYGCRVFLVDNLMTSRFDTGNDSNYYRQQSNFVGELVSFAKTYNVHVHLVAHPRKTSGKLENDDISGIGDITNRADNVLVIEREDKDVSSILRVIKNRSDGCMNEKIGMLFDKVSKRFYLESEPDSLYKKYGWEKKDFYEVQLEMGEKLPWD